MDGRVQFKDISEWDLELNLASCENDRLEYIHALAARILTSRMCAGFYFPEAQRSWDGKGLRPDWVSAILKANPGRLIGHYSNYGSDSNGDFHGKIPVAELKTWNL